MRGEGKKKTLNRLRKRERVGDCVSHGRGVTVRETERVRDGKDAYPCKCMLYKTLSHTKELT